VDAGLKVIKQASVSMPDQPLPTTEGSENVDTTNDGWSSWAASAVTSAASAAASRVMSSPAITPRESTNSQGSCSPKAVEAESLKEKPSHAFLPPKSKLIPTPSSKFQIPIPVTNEMKPAATDGWGWDDPEIPSSPVLTIPTPKTSLPHQTSSGWENEDWDKEEPQSPHTDAKKGWDEDW
jgi:hypothetical protein